MTKCPHCGKPPAVFYSAYSCESDHKWGEEVALNIPSSAPEKRGMKMPFGKHKGEFIEDLPKDYIEWVLGNCDFLRDDLREELENQILLSEGKGVVRQEVRKVGRKFQFSKE